MRGMSWIPVGDVAGRAMAHIFPRIPTGRRLVIAVALIVCANLVAMTQEFMDPFDGGRLASRWDWMRENPQNWSLSARPGFLRIVTQKGGLLGGTNNARNVLLTPAPPGDFEIETYVEFTPSEDFQIAGLVVYANDDNFLMVGRAFCSTAARKCVGNGIYFDEERDGEHVFPNFASATGSRSKAYLRLVKEGTTYRAYSSEDGSSWSLIGLKDWPVRAPLMVGLAAEDSDQDASPISADFGYFELRQPVAHTTSLEVALWATEPSMSAAIEAVLPEFEETYNVKVVINEVLSSDYFNWVITRLAAGDAPDVALLTPAVIPHLTGALLPLDGYVEGNPELLSGLSTDALRGLIDAAFSAAESEEEAFPYGGELWAIPFFPAFAWDEDEQVFGAVFDPPCSYSIAQCLLAKDLLKHITLSAAFRNPPYSLWAASGNPEQQGSVNIVQHMVAGCSKNTIPQWTCSCVHDDKSMTSVRDYYDDPDLSSTGHDYDWNEGVDWPMAFFYNGHATPSSLIPKWRINHETTMGTHYERTTNQNMEVGDWDDHGRLRYLFMASCELFAHGPWSCKHELIKDPSDSTKQWKIIYDNFGCPQDFPSGWSISTPSTSSTQNVYADWGHVLTPDLRMACGLSTSYVGNFVDSDTFWNQYLNYKKSVANSFMIAFQHLEPLGKTPHPQDPSKDIPTYLLTVPLCIALGGSGPNDSPLAKDNVFSNLPNSYGSTHYHIQYRRVSGHSANVSALVLTSLENIPDELPMFAATTPFGESVLLGDSQPITDQTLVSEEYVLRALEHIQSTEWEETQIGMPLLYGTMIAITPADGGDTIELQEYQKNVTVDFGRMIVVDGLLGGETAEYTIPVLGNGGIISVQMNNDGTLASAYKVWRTLEPMPGFIPVKSYEQAYEEAVGVLGEDYDPAQYSLVGWEWGYKEESGSVHQDVVILVFRFYFHPNQEPDEGCPVMIEIPGFVGM